MPADLSEAIENEAQLPASSKSDGQEAQGQPLPDLIAADRYLKGAASVAGTNATGGPRSAWRGLRAARAITPGAA